MELQEQERFMGSNAYNIIKYSRCPVLTIPKKKITSFGKILFPLRPLPGALTRFDIACNFFSANTVIEVLGLSYLRVDRETNVLDRIVNEIKDQLDMDTVKVNTSWGQSLSIAEDVIQFSQKFSPEMIVLTSSLDAVSKSVFLGPHTQKILNCCKFPILTIKKLGSPALA